MKALRWILPGLKVKRWFFLILAAALLISAGVATMLNVRIMEGLARANLLLYAHTGKLLSPRLWGALMAAAGLIVLVFGLRQLVRSITEVVSPADHGRLMDALYRKRLLPEGPRVVVLGGGTGLSTMLRGLKQVTTNLTAIVTVADDGGSSGRLRREMGILPPGDIRNCLVALADVEPLMTRLFQYRFDARNGDGDEGGEGSLEGHTLGNLLIAAMTDITGDFQEAVKETSKVLAIRGRVLPSTLENVSLRAELDDGEMVEGESTITSRGKRISRLTLYPERPPALPEALEAIREADMVVVGPGSLYTSVIPNLLVEGMVEALQATEATVVYVCNVMTQRGETASMTGAEHLQAIIQHIGANPFDYCLLNDREPSPAVQEAYRKEGAVVVLADPQAVESLGTKAVATDLLSRTQLARHDPARLATALFGIFSAEHAAKG